ncbi:MAG TPA: AAA family ATPase [Polyangia bacterium]|nr:AAA family ATPase [Polyangia bacterium]
MSWSRLEIQLLGEILVLHDGRPVELPPSKRTRALLAYLVATYRSHTRQRLCELLWQGPDDPRAALRWSLWKLRPLLDHGRTQRLVADRERVSFEPHGAEIDLIGVRALLNGAAADADTASLEAVERRCRGDFIDGVELPECYAFQEWRAGECEVYRSLRLDVLGTLATRLAPGAPERALAFSRRRVAIDPLSEDAHAQLIRLLVCLGRHADAIKQYDTCRHILEVELHRRPSAVLEQARTIIRAEVGVSDSRAPMPPPVEIQEPAAARPLVGRQAEQLALDEIVAAAREARAPEVTLLLGDPGIGKTRLLEALHERVRAAGGIALVARAFEAERTRPYGPFVDAFRGIALAKAPAGIAAEVSRLLPGSANGPPSTDGAPDKSRLFDAMARLLDWLAARRLVCLSIDDLHWLDEASVALLHYCVRQARGPVIFATAARRGELGDNPSALRLTRDLTRGRRLRQLAVGPLDPEAIAALVSDVPHGTDVAWVLSESEGHPLYALELARAGPGAGAAPAESLDELISDRLVRLEGRANDVLPWMAAMGRTVHPRLLAEATELPVGEVLSALAVLERRAVVRASPAADDRYDFAHDLIRRAAYRRISPPQRRLVHARIATAIAAHREGPETWAVDVARHADLGGDSALCVQACLEACARCLQVFAYGEAERLVELGQRHAARLADASRIRGQMQLYAILVHPGLKLHHPGPLGAQIADLCTEAADAGLTAECSLGFKLIAQLHHHAFGDVPRARAAIRRAVEVFDSLPAEPNLEPLTDGAYCLAYLEIDMRRTRALFDDLARLRGVEGLLGFQWGIGLISLWEGELDRARQALRSANTLAMRAKKTWAEFDTLAAIATVELEAREHDRVLALSPELERLADKLGESGNEGPFARSLAALARLESGDEEGAGELDGAIQALERVDSRYHLAYVLNTAAQIAFRRGMLAEARRRSEAAKRAADAVERIGESRRAELVLAAIEAREGRPEPARRFVAGARPEDLASLPRRTRDILPLLRELVSGHA